MIRARTPEALKDLDRPLEECIAECSPRSHSLLEAARQNLFYSLPVTLDPAGGTGCYLATVDREVIAQGYHRRSALMEERFNKDGPQWLRSAGVLRVVDNYLRSGLRFVYLNTALAEETAAEDEIG